MTQTMSRWSFEGMAITFRIRDWLKAPGKVLANADVQPGMTVVDYGCGPGSYAIEAARQVGPKGKVYAVDRLPLALERVRRRATRQKLTQVETLLVKDCRTSLPASSADRILMIDMIHMVIARDALLAEARRLIKPTGMLYVQVHHMPVEPIQRDLEYAGFTIRARHDNEMLAVPRRAE